MRLADYLEILENRVKKQSNTSAHSSYLKKEISLACQDHANLSYPWRELNRQSSVTLTADQDEYYLDKDFDSFGNIWHTEYDSYMPIIPVNPQKYYQSKLSTTNTGYPEIALQSSRTGVLRQPDAATVLSIASSSALDTNISIRVIGIVEGYPDAETIITNSSNGITNVFGTKQFSRIDGISKSASTIGRITLTASPNDIAVIQAGRTTLESKYDTILFHPIPDQSMSVYYNYKRKQFALTDDNDFSILSDNHDNAILILAQYYVYGETEKFSLYLKEVKRLLAREPGSSTDNSIIQVRDRIMDNNNNRFLSFGSGYAY